jgi:hypothetical protein
MMAKYDIIGLNYAELNLGQLPGEDARRSAPHFDNAFGRICKRQRPANGGMVVRALPGVLFLSAHESHIFP